MSFMTCFQGIVPKYSINLCLKFALYFVNNFQKTSLSMACSILGPCLTSINKCQTIYINVELKNPPRYGKLI